MPQALLGPRRCCWVALVDDAVIAILLLAEPGVEPIIVCWLQSSWSQFSLNQINEERMNISRIKDRDEDGGKFKTCTIEDERRATRPD